MAARVGASAWPGPRLTPRRGPGAERMSAQVRTRLCFRHLRAAAGRAGSELEKVGPVRPLAPGEPRSLQPRRRLRAREAEGHCNRETGAAPFPERHPPPRALAYPTEVLPAPPQRTPPGEGSPARAWMRRNGGSPGLGTRHLRRCPLRVRDLPGCATSEAAPPLARQLRGRRIAPGQRECASQSLTGRRAGAGGVSTPEADVSIWMGVVAAELPKRQPSAGTQLPHRLCSQRGGTGSRLHSASPPFGSPCTGRLGLPPRPLSRPAKLPRGARLGDYLEWQRSPAIGSVPAPSVGRDGANDQLPAKKKKKNVVLAGAKVRGFTRTPGCGGARA